MNISDIHILSLAKKQRKRVGRGTGSGVGKTSGRGHKGQGSRAGFSMSPLFEGGQMPLARRVPKRGFTNPFAKKFATINVSDLDELFNEGETVTPAVLKESKIIKINFDYLKILGDGELTKKLDIKAHSFSASAKDKIEKAGGQVTILPGKKPVVRNKMGTRKRKNAEK